MNASEKQERIEENMQIGQETGCSYMVVYFDEEGEWNYVVFSNDLVECCSLYEEHAELYDISGGRREPLLIPFPSMKQLNLKKLEEMGFEIVDEEKMIINCPIIGHIGLENNGEGLMEWMQYIAQTLFERGKEVGRSEK